MLAKPGHHYIIPTNLKDRVRVAQSQSLFERTFRAGQRTTVAYPSSSALTSLQTFCRNKLLGSSWSFLVLERDCCFFPLIFLIQPDWGCLPAAASIIFDLFLPALLRCIIPSFDFWFHIITWFALRIWTWCAGPTKWSRMAMSSLQSASWSRSLVLQTIAPDLQQLIRY